MKCISAINPVPNQPGRNRMDLHCSGKCRARSHMGVLTEDPKEWQCHDYNFSFLINNDVYYLSGYDYMVDPYNQHREPNKKATILSDTSISIIEMDFIPLSTGNDMHEEAWKLFWRLKNLVAFS